MALHTELEIYQTSSRLLLLVVKAVANMRRDLKYDLGGELRRECIKATVLIFRVNTSRKPERRYELLMDLLECMEIVTQLLRVGKELGSSCIPHKVHAGAIPLVTSIQKQANAWKRDYAPDA